MKVDFENDFGGENEYPPNWAPIDAHEFWDIFMNAAWKHDEHREMFYPANVHAGMYSRGTPKVKRTPVEARLFYYADGSGLAMVKAFNERARVAKPPRLFKFSACQHELVKDKKQSRRLLHIFNCSKCNFRTMVEVNGDDDDA